MQLRRIASTKVALRVLVLFIVGVILPLGGLAFFGLHHLSKELTVQADRRLKSKSKLLGMAVMDRLLLVDTCLGALAEGKRTSIGAAPPSFAGFFRRVQYQTDGELEVVLGDAEPILFAGELEAALSTPGKRLHPAPRPAGGPIVLLPMPGTDGDCLIAEIEPTFLWQSIGGLGTSENVVILDGDTVIHESLDPYDYAARSWSRGGWEDHLEARWRIFVSPQFGTNWDVVVADRRAQVLAPVQTFHRLFTLGTIVALLVACLVSLIQVRRNLGPIGALKEATAAFIGDASYSPIELENDDEFKELGDAFNEMAERIGRRTEALRRANRVKDEFLANMSHEIRTPLTSILATAQECIGEEMPREARLEGLRVIESSGQHLLRIVNDILDLSRVQNGRIDIRPERLVVDRLLGEIRSFARPLATRKDLRFELNVEGSLPQVIQADPVRIRQVLMNLITNAIKFTEDGSVALAVRGDGEEPALEFVVEDTGIGMTSEELDRVFDAFEQADASASRGYGGTGLGLTLSRAIAQSMGGTVGASSRPGEGSRFEFHLPVEVVDELDRAGHADEVIESAQEPQKLTGRILLAEDVALNRKLVARILAQFGLEVDEAEDGRRAVELFETSLRDGRSFDLILLDLQMPIMDGHEALRRIRQHDGAPPVIALTAHCLEEERRRCIEEGFAGFATKPIERQHLFDALAQHLAPSRRRRAA